NSSTSIPLKRKPPFQDKFYILVLKNQLLHSKQGHFGKMSVKRELIYIDGKDETDRVERYRYNGDRCIIVFKNSNKEFSYGQNRARIVRTAISSDKAYNVFNYLKEIADAVGLQTEEGNNILSKS